MDRKTVRKRTRKYWKMVREAAWGEAWERSKMKSLFLALAIVIVTAFVIGLLLLFGVISLTFFAENIFANSLSGTVLVVVSIVILLYFYWVGMRDIPPRLYDELGGFDPLTLGRSVQCSEGTHPETWVRVLLHNKSTTQALKDCEVDLKCVTHDKQSLDIIEDSLMWGGTDDKEHPDGKTKIDIGTDGYASINVARSNKEANEVVFMTKSEPYPEQRPVGAHGQYTVRLKVTGYRYNKRHLKEFEIEFSYLGGRKFECSTEEIELELEHG